MFKPKGHAHGELSRSKRSRIIEKIKRKIRKSNYLIKVIRVSGKVEKNIRNAKPCKMCTAFLKEWFPCWVMYSVDDGFYYGHTDNLFNDHLSYAQKQILDEVPTTSSNIISKIPVKIRKSKIKKEKIHSKISLGIKIVNYLRHHSVHELEKLIIKHKRKGIR